MGMSFQQIEGIELQSPVEKQFDVIEKDHPAGCGVVGQLSEQVWRL